MAGNKAIYDTAMKRAHDYAWANSWDRAIKEYDRALAEFRGDRTAERNKAQCFFRLKQWPQALEAYEHLSQEDPSDLFALNRLAEIYLASHKTESSQETYFRLADLYVANNQYHEAIRALRDFVRAKPDSNAAHLRLLTLTQEVGDRAAQVAEHLALSRIALDQSALSDAQQHADAASLLEPDNPDVRRWGYSVRRRLAEVAGTHSLPNEGNPSNDATGLMPGTGQIQGGQGGQERNGIHPPPYHQAQSAGSNMSTHVGTGLLGIEQESPEVQKFIDQANEAQSAGDSRLAMELYDRAVRAGARRGSAFYSAGLLNQQMGRHDFAIPYLERAAADKEFAISSNYMLGAAYSAQHNYSKAVAAFEKALQMIEPQSLTRSEADELIELYTAAAEAHLADNNSGRASSLYSHLVSIFKEKKWAHPRLAELQKKADELYNVGIASKLQGIGRSGMLTNIVGNGLPAGNQDMPFNTGPLIPHPMHVGHSPIEATRIMVEGGVPSSSTALMGPYTATDEGVQTVEKGGAQPGSEMATSMMRQPGSNLRTITEYLRAADRGNGHGDNGSGQSGTLIPVASDSGGLTSALPIDDPTEALRLASGIPSANRADSDHTYTNMPTSLLEGMERQSLTVQRLLAEAEYTVSHHLWDAAIDTCFSVIQLEPSYLPIHMMLGDIYLKQGKLEEAVDKYSTVLDAYLARSEPDHAADVCRLLLDLQPQNLALQQKLGVLLLDSGQEEAAASAMLLVAENFAKAGNYEKALEEALALKARLPKSSEVALAVGTYNLALDNNSDALMDLSRALRLDPGNNAALVRLYT
ncbi:MAG: tetratricopeptide repeat protein, partial [Chloroflexota bacterium]|nr:tetratricopeptide repeat protein [Chloroflexota bacterium]